MVVCGIDWSMTSPSWTVIDQSQPKNFQTFWFPSLKRHWNIEHFNLNKVEYPNWTTPEERYKKLVNIFKESTMYRDIDLFFLEGYAFAAQKSLIFNIAECTSTLKQYLYKITADTINLVPSSYWKKKCGLKGNSKKGPVINLFIKETGIDLYKLFQVDPQAKKLGVITDIADSYYIAKSGGSKI